MLDPRQVVHTKLSFSLHTYISAQRRSSYLTRKVSKNRSSWQLLEMSQSNDCERANQGEPPASGGLFLRGALLVIVPKAVLSVSQNLS